MTVKKKILLFLWPHLELDRSNTPGVTGPGTLITAGGDCREYLVDEVPATE
jgi:hypothetical protein